MRRSTRLVGAGLEVAVIDDGVDPGNPDLSGSGKVVDGGDCSGDSCLASGGTTPSGSHGTAVAALVAASEDAQGIVGGAHGPAATHSGSSPSTRPARAATPFGPRGCPAPPPSPRSGRPSIRTAMATGTASSCDSVPTGGWPGVRWTCSPRRPGGDCGPGGSGRSPPAASARSASTGARPAGRTLLVLGHHGHRLGAAGHQRLQTLLALLEAAAATAASSATARDAPRQLSPPAGPGASATTATGTTPTAGWTACRTPSPAPIASACRRR
jgi:Subtilase family